MPDQHTAAQEHRLAQELLAPRDALPEDPVSLVDDPEFTFARRGYERTEVDAYVRRVTNIVRDLVAARSPREAIRQALDRVGSETADILNRAHETAEEITSTSRREAEDRLETSRREAEERLQSARAEAERMIAAAEARVAELDRDADSVWQDRERILADVGRLSLELDKIRAAADERFPPDVAVAEEGAIELPAAGEPGDADEEPFEEDDPTTTLDLSGVLDPPEIDPRPAPPAEDSDDTVAFTPAEREEAGEDLPDPPTPPNGSGGPR